MSNRVLADKTTIPETICEREQWVCWKKTQRDGNTTKIPVTPGGGGFASSTDPETWAGFEIALEYARTGKADGVGFVFTDDDPIVGVDLDDCRDPETGEVDSEAQDIIERLDSYTEISPSGTGYHVLIEGELPEGRNRRGHIELYDRARFFTVTGEHIQETPTHIARRQDALVAIHREYVQRSSSDEKSNSPNRGDLRTSQTPLIVLTLRSTTRTLISMMRNSWRKLGVLQTDRSSSDSGEGTLVDMKATLRPIWPCVVYWLSGVAVPETNGSVVPSVGLAA